MITQKQLNALKANWPGELNCYVECRVFDPASCAEWYLIACDPFEEILTAIVSLDALTLEDVSIHELTHTLNADGENLQVDRHFRREKAQTIWDKLKRKREGTYGV